MTYEEIQSEAKRRFDALSQEEYAKMAAPIRTDILRYVAGRIKGRSRMSDEESDRYRESLLCMTEAREGDVKRRERKWFADLNGIPYESLFDGKKGRLSMRVWKMYWIHFATVAVLLISLLMPVAMDLEKHQLAPFAVIWAISAMAAIATTALLIVYAVRNAKMNRIIRKLSTPKGQQEEIETLVRRMVYERERDAHIPEQYRVLPEMLYVTPKQKWEKAHAKRRNRKETDALKPYDPGPGRTVTTALLKAEALRRFNGMTPEAYEARAVPIRSFINAREETVSFFGMDRSKLTRSEAHSFGWDTTVDKLNEIMDLPLFFRGDTLEKLGYSADDLRRGEKNLMLRRFKKPAIRLAIILVVGAVLFASAFFIEKVSRTVSLIVGIPGLLMAVGALCVLLRYNGVFLRNSELNKEIKKRSDPTYWEAEIETEVDRLIMEREKTRLTPGQ